MLKVENINPKEGLTDKVSVYHGNNIKEEKTFFEGWYFKISDSKEENSFGIICGIGKGDKLTRHSFVQIVFKEKAYYSKYPISDFSSSSKKFCFSVNKTNFDVNVLNINTKNFSGKIEFDGFKPWPITTFSNGIMGFTSIIPILDCNHGLVSFNSKIKGSITFTDNDGKKEEINYDNGKAYIEKDWGTQFPINYIWFQCNNFEKEDDLCVMGGIATFKMFNLFPVTGFSMGLYLNGDLFAFATYNFSKIKKKEISKTKMELLVENWNHQLKIEINIKDSLLLYAPYEGKMVKCVEESINSDMFLTLTERKTGKILFQGNGKNAGVDNIRKIEKIEKDDIIENSNSLECEFEVTQ